MPRLLACLFVAGAFALWTPPLHAETDVNKDKENCEEVTPVGGSVAPARAADWASRNIGRTTQKIRCKPQAAAAAAATAPAGPPYDEPPAAAPAPAEAVPEEEHHGAHLNMDEEEPVTVPNRNPWMSPPAEDSFGGERWR